MIVVGAVIGSGIFLTPSMIMRTLGDPSLVIGIWIFGGLMAVAGAFTFAELAHVLPRVGGIYAYLTEAYSPYAGFAYGWCMLLVMNSGSLAALCTACVSYIAYFFPMSAIVQKCTSLGLFLFLTAANIFGIRQGSLISNIFSLAKIIGIAVLIVGAIVLTPTAAPSAEALALPSGNMLSAFAVAMVGILWSYGGWQYATFPASEVRSPSRAIPISILIGITVIIILYLGANLAYLSVLGPAGVAREARVASSAAELLAGPAGGAFIAVLIAASTFGTASVYTLAAPRIYYAMSRDGLFFSKIGQLHPKYGTPAVALLVQCAVVAVLIFSGSFEDLISYVAFVDWIFYAAAAGAVFVFRKSHRDAERRYSVPGYPVTPAAFILVSIWFVIYLFIGQPVKSGIGLCILLASYPVYRYWRSKSGHETKSAPPLSDT